MNEQRSEPSLPEWAEEMARELLDGLPLPNWTLRHEQLAYALMAAADSGKQNHP